MKLESSGLLEEDVHSIREVLRHPPRISEAILYGSRAKGTHRPGSDIDLTLKGNELSHHDLLDIELALDDLLLPYKIDLSLYHQLEIHSSSTTLPASVKFFTRQRTAQLTGVA